MVNTELLSPFFKKGVDYNILNIVVNTERGTEPAGGYAYYNILNIVVNTEHTVYSGEKL